MKYIKLFLEEIKDAYMYVFKGNRPIDPSPYELPSNILILGLAFVLALIVIWIIFWIVNIIISVTLDKENEKAKFSNDNILAEIKRRKEIDKKFRKKHKSLKEIGDYAEDECANILKQSFPDMTVIKNVYPNYSQAGKRKVSQCDVIGITKNNIYVFEVKNYGGIIYPSDDLYWVSSTYDNLNPKGQREYKYNPAKQNSTHCRTIWLILKTKFPTEKFDWKKKVRNIVVFSDRTVMVYPEVTTTKNEFSETIMNMEDLVSYITDEESKGSADINVVEVSSFFEKYKEENVSEEIKKESLVDAKSHYGR